MSDDDPPEPTEPGPETPPSGSDLPPFGDDDSAFGTQDPAFDADAAAEPPLPDPSAARADSSAERALSGLERLPPPRRRKSRWDMPAPPHDWRWVVGSIGKVLIAAGLLMFAFVAYQLWGTGLQYAQAQDRLDKEFEQLLAAAPTAPATTTTEAPVDTAVDVPTVTTPSSVAPVTTVAPTTTLAPVPIPVFEEGDVIARIEIPSIGLDAKVVSGVQVEDLKSGPGHYPDTPMPGQFGNAAIAGHRTTYGQPFYSLNEVAEGDEVILTTVQGRFVYRMTGNEVVEADASQVVATTDPTVARLTLTTCHPRYTAAQRLILYADLDLEASSPPQPAVIGSGPAVPETPASVDTLPGDAAATLPPAVVTTAPAVAGAESTPTTEGVGTTDAATTTTEAAAAPTVSGDGDVSEEAADAFSHGWFSDDAAFGQVALWGFILTAIAIWSYLISVKFRRNWVGALIGIVPFAVVLYFFFQNVNRLLPAAL